MSELKNCPFCGEPADDRYRRLAKCSNKACLTNYWVEYDTDFYSSEDWNTRPIEDALQARIAELESTNDANKKLEARAERAEAMVTRLIEEGNILADYHQSDWDGFGCGKPSDLDDWQNLVAEWKEQQ